MDMFSEAPEKSLKEKLQERGFFRWYMRISVSAFLFGVAVYILARFCPPFAEFWARYPSQGIRFLLAKCSGFFRFSFAEWVILSIPLLVVAYFFFSNRSMKRDESVTNYYRWILPLICAILIVATLFLTAFGPCYFRRSLAENLSLTEQQVSAQELYDTAAIVAEQIDALKSEITFRFGNESIMPYDYDVLVKKINRAFSDYAAKEAYIGHFTSRAKPIASSSLFTYTHISGVYTFMTGEVNINLNYPDFIRPFTVAHEFSHQRGIAKEDEANFVAYLVCIGSDDPYIRYSGYVNMLQYLTDALWEADQTLYRSFSAAHMPQEVNGEFHAYSLFFRKYSESTVSAVTDAVNNTFLTSQGQKEGTASYGLVVDLAVAYYAKKDING